MYSWQQKTWEKLINAFLRGKLPNAILFSGAKGIGKSQLALDFTRFIICKKRINQEVHCESSDYCHDCHLINNNHHPAVYQIIPEKGHPIKIDQIRTMIDYIANTPFKSEYQCVIIHQAEELNEFAANSLLKTLEEPAANVFIILISNEKSRLLKTILSRVLQINLPVPANDLAISWLSQQIKKPQEEVSLALNIASGAPLKALALLQDDFLTIRSVVYNALEKILASPNSLLQVATILQDLDIDIVNELLLSFAADAAKLKSKVDLSYICNVDYVNLLKIFSDTRHLHEINQVLIQLNQIYHSLKRGIHLNKTLSLEYILMKVQGEGKNVFS